MDFENDTLRAWAGLILLILAILFIITGAENSTLEIIMIALAGFLVGGAILSGQNKK